MPATKDILRHVSIETAGKKRKCYRKSDHSITKGEVCLVVKDGPQNQRTYCTVCASDILEKAQGNLEKLTAAMSS
jgi:hypothetical protein